MIDERRNWFMQGATIALVILANAYWIYLGTLVIVLIFNVAIKRMETQTNTDMLGDGDKQIMTWLVPGLTLLGMAYSVTFLVLFGLTLLGLFSYKKATNHTGPFPGLVLICISYAVTIWTYFYLPFA